tara:strand:- start:85 stop:360 length:276 start_codon:yes stop_codon:yes gene_type:complete
MARMKKYYDGVSIPQQLPDSYMVGKGGRKCKKCHFYADNILCTKWKVMVRKNWVCKSYKIQENVNTVSTPTPSTPSTPSTNSNTGGSTGGY